MPNATRILGKMLDELMGNHRNTNPNDKPEVLTWGSRAVCPHYLVEYCPHSLFTNTKADLGPCPKIHKNSLKADFDAVRDTHPRKVEYTEDLLKYAKRLVNDLQSKIRRSKERLKLSRMEQEAGGGRSQEEQEEIEAKVTDLTEKINQLVTKAEAAGTAGDIEEAQGFLKLCDQLKSERQELKIQIGMRTSNAAPGFAENKQLDVCDVCGTFLQAGSRDKQAKIEEHEGGKQHIGYTKLRATIVRLSEVVKRMNEEVEREHAAKGESVFERNARLALAPQAITYVPSVEEEPVEVKKDAKEEGERSKSRSKERSREKRRSCSTGRRRRSRSRSRSRRSRDNRDRSRESKSRDYRSRERSRDRRSRDVRSREKSRERRRERGRSRD